MKKTYQGRIKRFLFSEARFSPWSSQLLAKYIVSDQSKILPYLRWRYKCFVREPVDA